MTTPHHIMHTAMLTETAGWTDPQKAALLHRLNREATRLTVRNNHPTAGALAQSIDTSTVQTPALRTIDAAIEWALSTPDARLAISIGPQEGKTTRVGVWGVIRALVQNPDRRCVIASYSDYLARSTARTARNIIREAGTGAVDPLTGASLPDRLGLSLADDKSAAGNWKLAGHKGGLYAVGVGGSLTGQPADCVSPHTFIISDHGRLTAAEAHRNPPARILAYDHDTGSPVWRRLEATRRIGGRRMLEVHTEAGRVLTCTPDHQIHTGRGYMPARDLRPGEALLRVDDARGVPGMRRNVSQDEAGHPQSNPPGYDDVLRRDMQPTGYCDLTEGELLRLRQSDSTEPESHLLGRLPDRQERSLRPVDGMPGMRGHVPAVELETGVLWEGLRGHCALPKDDRVRELEVHRREVVRETVPFNAATDLEARRPQVRVLFSGKRADGVHEERQAVLPLVAGGAPHRRGHDEQRAGESDHDVLGVPRDTPQVAHDTVSRVVEVGDGTHDAYDFQVEGTRNFFADGLLVHNCLIIDDPLKGMSEADSEVEREKVITWWESVAQTRLAPGAPVIIIATRWHEKDLTGHVLAQDKLRDTPMWKFVNIPAVSTPGVPDALDRDPGIAMESARGRTPADFARIRTDVGERVWSALYLGSPTPAQGGLFSQEWFDRHRSPELPEQVASRLVSVDPAETGKGDEAGIISMSVSADGRVWVTDDWSGRMQSDQWARKAVLLALTTTAGELLFEAFTTGPTYEMVLQGAWRRIRDEARLLRRHSGDLAAAALSYSQQEDAPVDPLAALRDIDGIPVPDQTDAPFRIHPWRAKGDKVARAAGTRQAAATGRLRMVGTHPTLESQATTWQAGQDSPDRMDALVNGFERGMQLVGGQSQIATPGQVQGTTGGMGANFWSTPIG